MPKPRKNVKAAFEPFYQEWEQLNATDWFQPLWHAIQEWRLSEESVDEDDADAAEAITALCSRIEAEFPLLWAQMGREAGWRRQIFNPEEPLRVREPMFGAGAVPYETSEENLERIRAEMRPGQLWVRVTGPGISKIEGYLEWRLRELAARGGEAKIAAPGRKPNPNIDLEVVRLRDDEGLSTLDIGKRFGWALQEDSYGNQAARCRAAEEAVKRGRQLRERGIVPE